MTGITLPIGTGQWREWGMKSGSHGEG